MERGKLKPVEKAASAKSISDMISEKRVDIGQDVLDALQDALRFLPTAPARTKLSRKVWPPLGSFSFLQLGFSMVLVANPRSELLMTRISERVPGV